MLIIIIYSNKLDIITINETYSTLSFLKYHSILFIDITVKKFL